jgi:hypothetical protein
LKILKIIQWRFKAKTNCQQFKGLSKYYKLFNLVPAATGSNPYDGNYAIKNVSFVVTTDKVSAEPELETRKL